MATETVASPPVPTTDDEVAKKVSEERKADEEDGVPLTKENGEEILKTDDSLSLETPHKSEAVDHEKIEPPVVEAEEIVDAPVSDFPLVDETKVRNDPIPDILEQVDEAEKNADAAVSDIPLVEESKVESDPIPDIPEQVVDAVKIPEEVESSTESIVREASKEPAIEIIEEGQVEQPKIVDAPQSSYEAIEKPVEPLEVTTDKESVETVLTEIKDSELESLEVQKPELATGEVEEKPGEPSEVTQEVETKLEEVELEKSVQDEKVKDEGPAADKVEPIPFLEEGKTEAENTHSLEVEEAPEQPKVKEEEKTHDEVGAEKSLEDNIVKDEGSKVEASTMLDGQTDKDYESSQVKTPEVVLLNRDGADYSLPDATETVASEDQKNEVTEVDVVEKLQEEAAVEIEKVGGEVLETQETEKEIAVTEYSAEPIKEEEKAGQNGIEVVEKLAEEASVKLETVREGNVETLEIEEKEKSNVITEESTQPIELDEKKELSGLDAVEKLAEEAPVKLGTVGEENVETLEIEEKEKSNVVTEESTQPIELDEKKELSGLDVVEKPAEEAAVEVEKVGEKNVESEDGKSVITEDEKKDLSGADVIEKIADETAVKLEEVGEDNVGKIAETNESEKKDEIIEDSSQPILADQKKESSGVDVVEKLAEDATVEFEKVEEANETKNVQSKDNDSKNVLDEVLTQQDKADVNSYVITPSEVIEKSFEGAGKDVEPAAENEKAEHIKDETPGTVETKKEDNVEEKQDEVTTLVTEPLGESKPSEPEVKGDEPVTLEKTIEDVAKSDRNIEPPAKDGDDTKSSEDLPKEVPAKPSQKQSNTILSKVKQTLVKAKRVITGKSPGLKTPASETKDDIKVK
ncbi:probable serine/threonine-protein kinase kinX isoform X2 [Rosa chinensis]|uniref:probable serine/threonine-protein kinase kinX isoform X2 n=1 Tax=Rosa chinensis TaxID=74649 RepID=UPI001AD943AA|nr:probable serine/threonine-protein kinase kinX isoform X2 [Rosa chinensis]